MRKKELVTREGTFVGDYDEYIKYIKDQHNRLREWRLQREYNGVFHYVVSLSMLR